MHQIILASLVLLMTVPGRGYYIPDSLPPPVYDQAQSLAPLAYTPPAYSPPAPPAYAHPAPAEPGIPYSFGYHVNDDEDSLNFGHMESSDGDVVAGTYKVALPDGRTQIVKYTADGTNGYVATVTYESAHAPAPIPVSDHHNYHH